MKERADHYFDEDVTKIVLGRPAKFSETESKDYLAESRLYQAAELAESDYEIRDILNILEAL